MFGYAVCLELATGNEWLRERVKLTNPTVGEAIVLGGMIDDLPALLTCKITAVKQNIFRGKYIAVKVITTVLTV